MPTETLIIQDATFVSSFLPDTNLSSYPLIYTGNDPGFQNCISFLEIALPILPVTSVDSAILQLTPIVKNGVSPSTVVVNNVTEQFSIGTVTFDTRPAFAATPAQIDVTTSDLYDSIQINVTGLVNDWLTGTTANNGIALTNSDGTAAFGTVSIGFEPYYPKLILTYSDKPVQRDTAICFSYAQLAHIIEQFILLYPTNVMTVFTTGLTAAFITGMPYQHYSSSEGTYGGLFVLIDNGQYEAIPLSAITAIYVGDGTVYDPSITFLPTPTFPSGVIQT